MRNPRPDYILMVDGVEIKFKNIQTIVEYLNKKVGIRMYSRNIISNMLNENRSYSHNKCIFFQVKRV